MKATRVRILVLLLLLLTMPVLAVPKQDEQGDYQQNCNYWEVSNVVPLKERSPLLGRSRPDEGSAATVRFPEGFVLQSQALVRDAAGRPWLKVCYSPGETCFVRAHGSHMHPAEYEPIKPDARGNYPYRTLHRYWKVVDTDPAGLNARLHPDFPVDFEDPRNSWPSSNVSGWPVRRTFAHGTVLKAVQGNVGMIIQHDSDGRAWLMVDNPAGGVCFVRANKDFIRPVAGPFQRL